MKIRPLSAELLLVDSQIDIQTHLTRLRVLFCKFGKALKSAQPEVRVRYKLV